MILKTANEPSQMVVDIEKRELIAGGQELAFLMISIVDENGVLNTSCDKKIKISMKGPGIIQGFGSADPLSLENFHDKERTTFDGKILAALRSGNEAGRIDITIKAEGLPDKEITLTSKWGT